MKHMTKLLALLIVLSMVLTGCVISSDDPTIVTRGNWKTEQTTEPTTAPSTEPIEPPTEPTEPPTIPTTPPAPLHSDLYIPGVDVEDVIVYFNEVCLDAEYSEGGDASLLQRWAEPIYYEIYGNFTEEDMITFGNMVAWLNTIDGFPGIFASSEPYMTNLEIYFCSENELVERMGENYIGCDGAVTFWYLENEIYNETICYRNDINQYTRNSVILEEIYNGLGPVQDTDLREDSLIYSGFSEPQWMTEIDELILKLLYNPLMEPGMNAAECETIIRQLYY